MGDKEGAAGARISPGMTRIICVMGVAGCGKSTVGAALAARLGGTFIEADTHHPPANIAKMTAGTPLTDEDRWPWLVALGGAAREAEGRVVLACSALRRDYRERLSRAAAAPIFFAHLAGDKTTIGARMGGRSGHFMPPALLDSQFATLEPLSAGEIGATLDILRPPEALIEDALAALEADL